MFNTDHQSPISTTLIMVWSYYWIDQALGIDYSTDAWKDQFFRFMLKWLTSMKAVRRYPATILLIHCHVVEYQVKMFR